MMLNEQGVIHRFHQTLVREMYARDPQRLGSPFTVAEIYQDLVPYRTHRDKLGVEMNADYEHALLRLLAGEDDLLALESETARKEIREELESPNPNTGLYRDFAAADVRLNLDKLDAALLVDPTASGPGEERTMVENRKLEEASVEPEEELEEDLDDELLGADAAPSADADLAEDATEEELDSGESLHQVSERQPHPRARRGVQAPADAPAEDDLPFDNCPWCREKLPQRPGVRFCPFCGSNVRLIPCPACGEELELNWRFCVACGTEVQS
jgi:hypothetical protein